MNITEHNKAEEELGKHRIHLSELVKERTGSFAEGNGKLRIDITEHTKAEHTKAEQARAEQELKSCRLQLEELVEARTADLKKMESEKALLREQLFQAQKMEAVGQLAGGVIHEFNNLLAVIIGNADIALMTITRNDFGYEELIDIKESTRIARDINIQLLAFARKSEPDLKPVSVKNLIKSAIGMFEKTLPGKIKINIEELMDIIIRCDATRICQILINICNNAKDAMPEGGEITIKTQPCKFSDEYCKVNPDVNPGKYCNIKIIDTGAGMTGDVKEKIFEPFFTTKEVGKGTGLGLSVTMAIIRDHQGWISVDSEPGKGTCFNVYLPEEEAYRLEPKLSASS